MNSGASKFNIFSLIILFCVINLEFAACYKCQFEYETDQNEDYEEYYNYLCIIIPDSSSIDEYHLDGKTDNDVWKIIFSETKKESVPFCQRFQSLKKIEMSEIKSVDENMLQQCRDLGDVRITNSTIDEFPEDIFVINPMLTSIHINDNKLRTLPENVFINQKHLKDLYLSRNQLNCLPPDIFKSLTKLWFLNLSENKFHLLNPSWFENLHSLQILNLEKNQIQDFPKDVFTHLTQLEGLYMSGNQLTTIHSDSFGIHKSLQYIGFVNNKINAIDSNFIDKTGAQFFEMKGNVCYNKNTDDNYELEEKLSTCFKNYQPRVGQSGSIASCINKFVRPTQTTATTTTTKFIEPTTTTTATKFVEPTTRTTTIKYVRPPEIVTTTKFVEPPSTTTTEFIQPTETTTTTTFVQPTEEETSTESKFVQPETTTTETTTTKFVKPMEDDTNLNNQHLQITTTTIECGTRNLQAIGLIHGGTLVKRGEFPWNVAMIRNTGIKRGEVFCGGTLVSNRNIVTAAHCIKSKNENHVFGPEDITVMLGVHNYKKPEELGRISTQIKSINIHKHWNVETINFDADIAILELTNEVHFNNYIRPICIDDDESEVAETSHGTVVGFGVTENGEISDIANKLEISILDYHNCTIASLDHLAVASARTFCGGPADGRGVCTGDSGSGFYVKRNDIFYLRGLVSSSLTDKNLECNTYKQAIFTDVTQYYDWIIRGGTKKGKSRKKRFLFV